jgi:hypothetical protein
MTQRSDRPIDRPVRNFEMVLRADRRRVRVGVCAATAAAADRRGTSASTIQRSDPSQSAVAVAQAVVGPPRPLVAALLDMSAARPMGLVARAGLVQRVLRLAVGAGPTAPPFLALLIAAGADGGYWGP